MKLILKTLVLNIFLLSFSQFSFAMQSIECSINGTTPVEVTCDKGWARVRSYNDVRLRIKNCFKPIEDRHLEIQFGREFKTIKIKLPITELIGENFLLCRPF